MKRRLLLCALACIEPCVHIVGALTGVYLPHPEGLTGPLLTYLSADRS